MHVLTTASHLSPRSGCRLRSSCIVQARPIRTAATARHPRSSTPPVRAEVAQLVAALVAPRPPRAPALTRPRAAAHPRGLRAPSSSARTPGMAAAARHLPFIRPAVPAAPPPTASARPQVPCVMNRPTTSEIASEISGLAQTMLARGARRSSRGKRKRRPSPERARHSPGAGVAACDQLRVAKGPPGR